MSLYDFFFPQQAAANYLRSMAKSKRFREARESRAQASLDKKIESLEADVGYLALVLGALLEKADEKGVLSRDEVRAAIAELDDIDGVEDGRLDVNILRGMER